MSANGYYAKGFIEETSAALSGLSGAIGVQQTQPDMTSTSAIGAYVAGGADEDVADSSPNAAVTAQLGVVHPSGQNSDASGASSNSQHLVVDLRSASSDGLSAAGFSTPSLIALNQSGLGSIEPLAFNETSAGTLSAPTASTASAAVDFFGNVLPTTPGTNITYTAVPGAEQITGTSKNETFIADKNSDVLIGGGGSDSYAYVSENTTIIAQPGGVNTAYQSGETFTLPANVQNLTVWSGSASNGNSMANIIRGSTQNDLIDGGAGNDVLTGFGGCDTFIFDANSGYDVITDFTPGTGAGQDTVRLPGYAQFQTFAQVQAAMTQVGADVILKLDSNDAIKFNNTTIAAFTSNNFMYELSTAGFKLTFDDEFNTLSTGTAASGAKWLPYFTAYNGQPLHTESGGSDKEIYVDPTYAGKGADPLGINPYSINNGVLTITAAPTPTADLNALSGYAFTSGVLTTQQSFAQKYGYFDARMELPTGTGAFPAFWLLPTDNKPPAEIDVIEAHGANTISTTVHTGQTGVSTASYAYEYIPQATTGFHDYGVLWTPTEIAFYVDQTEVFATPTPADMTKPMYMLLDLAVSANAPSNFTSSLMVDYVRAYSINGLTQSNLAVNSITANTPAGTVAHLGQSVELTVNLSESVTVSGAPSLTLSNGETASYVSGSGSSTLVFDYTVSSGDDTSDLKVTGLTFSNQSSITASDGATPPSTVISDLSLAVNATPPKVTGVTTSLTSGGVVLPDQSITITVSTSEAVTVSGTPVLQLSDGETAVYSGGSGTNALSFTYTATSGDSSSSLECTGVALGQAGAIVDSAGNALSTALAVDLHLSVQPSTFSGTATTVASQLDALQNDANLSAVNITDAKALAISASQASLDSHAVSLIQGAHVVNVTGVTGQDYTTINEQFDASGNLTTEVFSGITDQAYTSYTKAFSNGVLTTETFNSFNNGKLSKVKTFDTQGDLTSKVVTFKDGESRDTIYHSDGSSVLSQYSATGVLTTITGYDMAGVESYESIYDAQGHILQQNDFYSNGVQRLENDHAADGGLLTIMWQSSGAFLSENGYAADGHQIYSSDHYVPASDVIF